MERWEFCIQATSQFFSYGLGSLYERTPERMKNRAATIKMVSPHFQDQSYFFNIVHHTEKTGSKDTYYEPGKKKCFR